MTFNERFFRRQLDKILEAVAWVEGWEELGVEDPGIESEVTVLIQPISSDDNHTTDDVTFKTMRGVFQVRVTGYLETSDVEGGQSWKVHPSHKVIKNTLGVKPDDMEVMADVAHEMAYADEDEYQIPLSMMIDNLADEFDKRELAVVKAYLS